MIAKLREAAASCPTYREIFVAFKCGKDPTRLPDNHPARQLLSVWGELSALDEGLLCVDGKRIFVPLSCRRMILDKIHEAHPGITRMYRTARVNYFWPGLKNDVANVVNVCVPCQRHQASLPEDVRIPTKASAPMEQTSADLFQIGNVHYLLLVDRFSKFPLVSRLSSLSSKAVIDRLKTWFFLFGFPRSIRTDGGPQFRSEFRKFCDHYSVIHELSSPYHPEGNGAAEVGVKAVKALMMKTTSSTFEEAFSIARNTCGTDGNIPSSLFFSRTVRTAIPVVDTAQPLTEQKRPPRNLDRLRSLAVGTRVRVQDPRTRLWNDCGEIVATNPIGRTYNIRLDSDNIVTRNRRFIRQSYV